MKRPAFTLIELLVVIVIIGILSTISTATFTGYFRKARDTERQTFVRNAEQILLANTIDNQDSDSYLGGGNGEEVKDNLKALFQLQGAEIPAVKNEIRYFYAFGPTPDALGDPNPTDFLVLACKEDSLTAADDSDPSDHMFIAGTRALVANTGSQNDGDLYIEDLSAVCGPDGIGIPFVTVESSGGGLSAPNWAIVDITCDDDIPDYNGNCGGGLILF